LKRASKERGTRVTRIERDKRFRFYGLGFKL
jgi:hypothetical protein